MKRLSYAFGILLLSACSLIEQTPPAAPPEKLAQVRYTLYVSRASLATTEFEQYKLLPSGLYAECGTIHRGRPETKEQVIEKVADDSLQASREMAYEVYEKLRSSDSLHVDQPGTNASLVDPGKYILSIQVDSSSAELKTSLDFVERRQESIAKEANALTQLIRGMTSKPLCGNGEFYGLGRRS